MIDFGCYYVLSCAAYSCVVCFDAKYKFKVFQVHDTQLNYLKVIPYIVSLVSLKESVKRSNVEVLNILEIFMIDKSVSFFFTHMYYILFCISTHHRRLN